MALAGSLPETDPIAAEFSVPQMAAPQPFDFTIGLAKGDRETFARQYGVEIERALQARRSGGMMSSHAQWVGDANPATQATRIEAAGARSVIKSWEQEIQDNWSRYDMQPPDRELPFEGAANYRTGLTRLMTDAILARIMAGVATIRPIFRAEAQEGTFQDIEQAGDVESFLDWSLENEVDFVPWLDDALIQAGVEGAAIGYLTWQTEREHRLVEIVEPSDEPISTDGGTVMKHTTVSRIKEVDEVVEAHPHLDLIPLTDFLVGDPRRKRLRDQPWMGHRSTLYRAELVQLKGQPGSGYFDDEIDDLITGAGNQTTAPSTRDADRGVDQRTGVNTTNQTSQLRMLDKFEVWTLIAWYDWDLDGKPERVVAEIAMPQKRLIRLIKYPYLHNRPFYIPIVLKPRPNSFYPYSLVGDMRMDQDELDALSNQRTDATAIAIASLFMFLYDEQAGFDPGRVKFALGESIKVDGDINHVQVMAKAFKGVQVPGMEIINYILDMARQKSGIHTQQTGGMESKRTTAFEVGAVIQEGNVQFKRMIERVSVALSEIAYQIIALYQQHADRSQPKVFKVLNAAKNPFRTIDVGELAGRWNYRVHGMAIAGQRDLDTRKAFEFLDLGAKHPWIAELVAMDPRRKYAAVRTFLDKIGWPVEETIGREDQFRMLPLIGPGGPGAGPTVDPRVEQMAQKLLAQKGGSPTNGGGSPTSAGPESPGEAGAAAVAEGTGL